MTDILDVLIAIGVLTMLADYLAWALGGSAEFGRIIRGSGFLIAAMATLNCVFAWVEVWY